MTSAGSGRNPATTPQLYPPLALAAGPLKRAPIVTSPIIRPAAEAAFLSLSIVSAAIVSRMIVFRLPRVCAGRHS
jgi:hypothetical protein